MKKAEAAQWVSSPRARDDIAGFLRALEERLSTLAHLADRANDEVRHRTGGTRFTDFARSRTMAAECWAFSIVIERRIELYRGPESEGFQQTFDRLTVAIWTVLLETSLRFLEALSKEDHLPLGSREIFVREIKTLYDSHRLLIDPRYAGLLEDDVRRRQDQAVRILETIIERAPALLDFSQRSAA